MKIALHIGLPKTGTTYFQIGLYQRLFELRALDWIVPKHRIFLRYGDDGGTLVNHNPMQMALDTHRKQFAPYSAEEVRFAWPAALTEIEQSDNAYREGAVISSESFSWGLANISQIKQVRDYLANHDTHVYVVTREPGEFAESIYLQAVEDWGFSGTPQEFMDRFSPRLELRSRLQQWRDVFGADRMFVMAYEDIPRDAYFGTLTKWMIGTALPEPDVPERTKHPGIPQEYFEQFIAFNREGRPEESRKLAAEIWKLRLPRARVFREEDKARARELALQ